MPEMPKCEECGEQKPDVQWMPDPFAENVSDETWMRHLCEDDAQARFEES